MARERASRLDAARRLPLAVVRKTCEILLSPPGHLIGLMLRVAARIAAGEWRGLVWGEGGERVVWGDYSSSSDEEDGDEAEGDGGFESDWTAAVEARRRRWSGQRGETPRRRRSSADSAGRDTAAAAATGDDVKGKGIASGVDAAYADDDVGPTEDGRSWEID